MKIAVDIREIFAAKTGKGFYTKNLLLALLRHEGAKKFNFILYSNCETDVFAEFENVKLEIIVQKGLFWHWQTYKSLFKNKIDLFWAPTSFIIPFLLGPKLPFIITVHDIVALLFPSKHNRKAVMIEKLTLKRAIKYAAKVLVVSKHTGEDLKKFFHISEDRLLLTYNSLGVEGDIKANVLTEGEFILNIGTLEPRKNQIRLIQAFDQIKDEFSELKLIIGGGKGWNYEDIYAEVKTLGLDDRVKFLGYVADEDLPALYAAAELFAYPSLYEGFGMPIIEAMSRGCPVLTANNSSLPEVSGEAAILVDAENVDDIADGLRKILSDKSLRKSMIEKGHIQVKKFSWKESAEKVLEFISS